MGPVAVIGKSHITRGRDREFADIITAIDEHTAPDAMIVFKRRREMYPVLHIRPDLAARAAQLDFDVAAIPNVSRMSHYERDVGRKVQQIYPDLRMASAIQLPQAGKFFVVAPIEEFKELSLQLPGFQIADSDGMLHAVTAKQ